MGIGGIVCAIQAGCCAALASVSAKLAVSSDSATNLVEFGLHFVNNALGIKLADPLDMLQELTVVARLLGVAGIIMFNAIMWVLFTKSMHLCSSTLEATAFNTSSNFFFTAVLGKLLFGEHLNLLWYLGSALMVAGLAVLHSSSSEIKDSSDAGIVNKRPGDQSTKEKES